MAASAASVLRRYGAGFTRKSFRQIGASKKMPSSTAGGDHKLPPPRRGLNSTMRKVIVRPGVPALARQTRIISRCDCDSPATYVRFPFQPWPSTLA